jgi:hypothetical protein
MSPANYNDPAKAGCESPLNRREKPQFKPRKSLGIHGGPYFKRDEQRDLGKEAQTLANPLAPSIDGSK